MKKQRGLKVFLSAALAGSQLLSAMTASAQIIELTPAPAGQKLCPVPEQSVQQISHESGEQTSVQKELRKLVHEEQVAQAPAIQLVQMNGQPQQQMPAQQNLRAVRKAARDERRKTGFFRRLFTDNSQPEKIAGVGAPPPKIPNPPALVYRSVAGRTVQTGGVPGQTMTVSNSSAPGKPTVPVVTSNAKPSNGNAKSSSEPAVGGFLNPFETVAETDNADDRVLLDLDALVADEQRAADGQDAVVAVEAEQVPVVESVQEVRESAVEAEFQAQPSEVAAEVFPVVESDSDVVPERVELPAVDMDDVQPIPESAQELTLSTESPEQSGLEAVPLLEVEAQELMPADVVSLDPVGTQGTAEEVRQVDEPAVVQQPITAEPVTEGDDVSPEERRRVQASRARRDHQTYRIMARTGKMGFKGFCPVELRDNRELVDSRTEYKSRFGLQTYYFSSPEAQAAFEKEPSRYAPAAGGSDVVLLVNTSEEEPGSLDFSLWYRDRLFLFRSRETQQLFSRNPARYANQY